MPITAQQLARLEREHLDGLTMFQILGALAEQGIRVSEATFRKYVQLGLLPQSRLTRCGQGGRHSGSQGLYPPETVRYLLLIKARLSAGAALADLCQEIGLLHRIEGLRHRWRRLRQSLLAKARQAPPKTSQAVSAEITALDRGWEELVTLLRGLANTLHPR